ncbi:DMT family transporter [Rhizobiales bacterium]|uniref:DMT family transporter n=1 Tax=Hongsoonwoonella zoysiae TaxID=2821844 RepID=UPI001560E8B0|nr:DMT family transporter [Hongsoonwoonella zoysiae]NRG17910.1 DMT family transporter [Hongsoonwoonella zoysiae]
MAILALSAALGASLTWAAAGLIAHVPALRLGSFEFTRIQLISSSAILIALVTVAGGWATVDWGHWPGFAGSVLFGVLLSNLAMAACLRRGGPRRTQLLMAMNAPISAILGYWLLGETLSLSALLGAGLAFAGLCLAILYGRSDKRKLEPVEGTLAGVILFGLAAAAFHAIGLIALKPVLRSGTDPLAVSALRTGGGAFAISLIALWPAKSFEPLLKPDARLVAWTILPGVMGYVVAVSLLLYALANFNTGIAAVLGSLSPVLILPMIWLISGASPRVEAWAGALLVVCGIALIISG